MRGELHGERAHKGSGTEAHRHAVLLKPAIASYDAECTAYQNEGGSIHENVGEKYCPKEEPNSDYESFDEEAGNEEKRRDKDYDQELPEQESVEIKKTVASKVMATLAKKSVEIKETVASKVKATRAETGAAELKKPGVVTFSAEALMPNLGCTSS